ncbi:MAG: hypothetical protein DCC75_11645 [Proteobacteria bacterium]|nr:MAG: hypothetical protein DCC75_11645 [Pseudomonadota bacterium]
MLELLIIIALVALNGVCPMSEIALVSARKARLKRLAEAGNSRAKVALELAANPTSLLSTVQSAITLVGIFAGAFGGATLAGKLGRYFMEAGLFGRAAEEVALAVVVVGITFISIIFGELIPKRIAWVYADSLSLVVAKPTRFFYYAGLPAVKVLSVCTDFFLKILGLDKIPKSSLSADELHVMLAEGQQAGLIEKSEGQMLERILNFDSTRVDALMTPREDVLWINTEDGPEKQWQTLISSGHTYLPVCEGSFDAILGVVSVKSFIGRGQQEFIYNMKAHLRQPLVVPDSTSVLKIVEEFKRSGEHIALVVDEHGTFEGLITQIDLLEGIVGELPSGDEEEDPMLVQREDGSYLIDGRCSLNELSNHLELEDLPEGANDSFHSVAGLVMTKLGAVPKIGQSFELDRHRFEVIDMDGRRIDKVLISKSSPKRAVPSP